MSRRTGLAAATLVAIAPWRANARAQDAIAERAECAKRAYAEKRLGDARTCITDIIDMLRDSPEEASVWYERRGQVNVDMKAFRDALDDFKAAEACYPPDSNYVSLGLLANRGLALEGLSMWREADVEYTRALAFAESAGYTAPYLLNSRGNVRGSLGRFGDAAEDFDHAAEVFQRERNLAGAIYAASNAALSRIEATGDVEGGERELRIGARRAAGSIDARAALAALYWGMGQPEKAEENWEWCCTQINSGVLPGSNTFIDGCGQYSDMDWLGRIRRWPPSMVARMDAFLKLRPPIQPQPPTAPERDR